MLARKTVLLFAVSMSGSALGFLSTIVVARWMGAGALGTVSYYLALLGMLSVFLDMGLAFSHLKRVAETEEDPASLIGTYLVLKLFLAVIFLLLALLLPAARNLLGYPTFASPQERSIYAIIAATYVCHSLASVLLFTFEARMETAREGFIVLAGSFLSFVAKVAVAFMGWGVVALSGAYLLEPIILILCAIWLFRGYRVSRPTLLTIRDYVRYAFPLSLDTGVSLVNSNLNPVLIGAWWSPTEVGYYGSVIGFGALLDRVAAAASVLFFPQASTDAAHGRWEELHRRLFVIERYVLVIVGPLAVALFAFAQDIVRIALGPDFLAAGSILSGLAISSVVAAVFQPYAIILYAIEKQRSLLSSSLVGLGALLTVSTLLVPRSFASVPLPGLAGTGAAIALVAMALARGCFQQRIVRRYTGIPLYSKLWTHVLAGLAMYACLQLLKGLLQQLIWWFRLPLLSFIGLAFYLSILVLTRQFTASDARVFLNILHPQQMAKYIAAELSERS